MQSERQFASLREGAGRTGERHRYLFYCRSSLNGGKNLAAVHIQYYRFRLYFSKAVIQDGHSLGQRNHSCLIFDCLQLQQCSTHRKKTRSSSFLFRMGTRTWRREGESETVNRDSRVLFDHQSFKIRRNIRPKRSPHDLAI